MTVKIGDKVRHRGHVDFVVVALEKHPRGEIATFENERFLVKCNAVELVERDGAFHLPYRAEKRRDELTVVEAIALGVAKGNLSAEGAERKATRFAKLIAKEAKDNG